MIKTISPLEVGICVNNLEQMISFYNEVLGFQLVSQIEVEAGKSKETGFTKVATLLFAYKQITENG